MSRASWQTASRISLRRGGAMALALVVLLVVALASGLTLQAILRSHRASREHHQRLQAELLADSAVARAREMLRKDVAWKGETWTVDLESPTTGESPDSDSQGVATTRVETDSAKGRSRIIVSAIYPNDPVHRAQAARDVSLVTPSPGGSP
jgi:type II secretory pathway pseudopilin PulG